MTFSIKDVNLKGCIMEPVSPKSYSIGFSDARVPDRVDLRPRCTRVEDQGRIGSCTANAAVGALEYHYICRDGRSPDLSRMFVYYNSRRLQGDVYADAGATIPQAMASLLAYGACEEAIWPYDPALFAAEPPRAAYDDGRLHEAVQYARVDSGPGAIQALAQGLPVVFGTWLPARCYEEAARTGVIPQPTEEEKRATPSGGHSMLIVGYDKPTQMFIVRNSWGSNWGSGGYCKIPFDVMSYFSPPDQFWVVVEMERPGDFTLMRPDLNTNAPSPLPEMKTGGMAETASRMRNEIRSSIEAEIGAASQRIDALLSGGRQPGTMAPPGQGAFKTSCYMCGGSGRCYHCSGTGSYGPGTVCPSCSATGRCYPCSGTGRV